MTRLDLEETKRSLTALARLGALCLLLAGCGAGAQGERVFAQQNRASAALTYSILNAELDQADSLNQLYDAEASLKQACGALQEAGARGMNQEDMDLFLHLRVFGALDPCAAACYEVESLIWRLDSEIAEAYLAKPVAAVSVEQ